MDALIASEAAELLRVSVPMVHKPIHTQGLPHFRLGRRVIIPRDRLEKWLEGSVQEGV